METIPRNARGAVDRGAPRLTRRDERNVTMLIRIAGLAAIAALTPPAVMAQAGGAEGGAEIRPFEIAVPDDVLDDLRHRLERTRLPDQLDGAGWDYGAELDYVTELITYWRDEFDWRAQERKLNAFDQYKTVIGDLRHPLHPPALARAGRAAADHHPRLARVHRRVHEDHRPADRPRRPRRAGRGCVPRRGAVHARLRVLGQAAGAGVRSRADRRGGGRAHGAAGLRALRHPGRRLGLDRQPLARVQSSRADGRRAPQHAGRGGRRRGPTRPRG